MSLFLSVHLSVCPFILPHHISGTIHHNFWYTCVNEKWKLHMSCIVSQEQCSIWSWFLVHLCKMISPCAFFISSKFWFFRLLEGERAKNGPKWQNIMSVVLHISGTIHHMIVMLSFMVHMCKIIIISPAVFSFSQNFNFLGC